MLNLNFKLFHIFYYYFSDPYDDDSNPIPSTTSPYYTLSNRSSHQQHHHLNGIAELPVSVSGLPQQSDPFSNLPTTKGIPIDLQQYTGGSRTRFSYSTSPNGTQIIIPDVIDISQQQQADGGTSLDFRQNHHQKQYSYSGPPPYRNPPQTLPGTESTSPSSTNGQIQPCSQSVPDSPVDSTYHTHSAKFPVSTLQGKCSIILLLFLIFSNDHHPKPVEL